MNKVFFAAKHTFDGHDEYLNLDGFLTDKYSAHLFSTKQEAVDAITTHVAKFSFGDRTKGWKIMKLTLGVKKEEEA